MFGNDTGSPVINLTTRELAERLRVMPGTLANWRMQGRGPRYIKVGSLALYPLAEVEAYEQRQLRGSTGE